MNPEQILIRRKLFLSLRDHGEMRCILVSTMRRARSRRSSLSSQKMESQLSAGKSLCRFNLVLFFVFFYFSQNFLQLNILFRKYRGFNKDRTGFRVYNAWYQHRRENKIKNDPRVVVQHPTDAPIRPHHRLRNILQSSSLYKDDL